MTDNTTKYVGAAIPTKIYRQLKEASRVTGYKMQALVGQAIAAHVKRLAKKNEKNERKLNG